MHTRSATKKTANGCFEIIQLNSITNVRHRIENAILASRGTNDRHTSLELDGADDASDWEDDVSVCSSPPTPLSRPSTPLSDFERTGPLLNPSSTEIGEPEAHSIEYLCTTTAHQARQTARKKIRRKAKRQEAAQNRDFGRDPQRRHSQVYRAENPVQTQFSATDVEAAGNGAWTGMRKKPRGKTGRRRRVWSLRALEDDGVEYIEWNGRDPKLIVDADGRIVAVLVGRPEGDDWDELIDEINRLFDAIRRRGYKRRVFKAGTKSHRRGTFHLLFDGYSFGSGQRRPGNLRHAKEYRKLVRHLLESPVVRRVAGFQSSALARYFPDVYDYYRSTIEGIESNQPELIRPFDNSVYPACTWNLGPATVTAEHRDSHNLAHGVCPITSFGNFNHKRGGQLYLRQLNVVIEFPSGSTAAILSGAFDHGNTPIGSGETRYSMTQYAAGALFRWARYGYQTAKTLLSRPDGAALKAKLDGPLGERAEWAVGLLSKATEVEEDFNRVFP